MDTGKQPLCPPAQGRGSQYSELLLAKTGSPSDKQKDLELLIWKSSLLVSGGLIGVAGMLTPCARKKGRNLFL